MTDSICEALTAPSAKPWSVYLVRAANGALYCGISDDPQRRFAKHQSGKGARFFASSPAVALVYVEVWPYKGEALRQERLIKRLRKSAKEALVASYTGDADGPFAGRARSHIADSSSVVHLLEQGLPAKAPEQLAESPGTSG
jgi:putative endonuclease